MDSPGCTAYFEEGKGRQAQVSGRGSGEGGRGRMGGGWGVTTGGGQVGGGGGEGGRPQHYGPRGRSGLQVPILVRGQTRAGKLV